MIGLFDETRNSLGSTNGRHAYLLWSLERLTWSPDYLSRAVLALARLSEVVPAGISNHPNGSLVEALHLVFPQGAVTPDTRLELLDMLRRETPDVAWDLEIRLLNIQRSMVIVQRGPIYRDWRVAHGAATYADVHNALVAIADRAAADADVNESRWTALVRLLDQIPPTARDGVLTSAETAWRRMTGQTRASIIRELRTLVDRHREFSGATWALDEESLQSLHTFIETYGDSTVAQDEYDAALFAHWPRSRGLDPGTEEGQAAIEAARTVAVSRLLPEGLTRLLQFAESVEAPELIGVALADNTPELDGTIIPMLAAQSTVQHRVALGYAARLGETHESWLRGALARFSTQATDLLLTARIDSQLLQLIETQPEEVRTEFWRRVQPWPTPETLVDEVVQYLLAVDRPFSAVWLLGHRAMRSAISPSTALAALQAVRATSEDPEAVPSVDFAVGQILDRLSDAGVERHELAALEWFFDPMLHFQREPKALYETLAEDPNLFADFVAAIYKSDEEGENERGEEVSDEGTAERARIAEASWRVLHNWRSPLPGQRSNEPARSEAVQAWVDSARAAIGTRRRSRVASLAIGEALSGPYVDDDGIWPCRAVRDVVQHESDSKLEDALTIGHMNQRGVTTRSPYAGGTQERTLVEQYRTWADRVRSTWPRVGALLDGLARAYEFDARREDHRADRQADR